MTELQSENERLKAENARLAAVLRGAPHDMDCNLEQGAPFDGVQCNCFKAKWPTGALREMLAPTVELLTWMNNAGGYGFDFHKRVTRELSRLRALMGGSSE